MDEVHTLLSKIRSKGVLLWAERGDLRYRAPVGALTQPDIARLRSLKPQILSHLAHPTSQGEADLPAGVTSQAPLAFTQLAHWQLYSLESNRAIRQVASVMRAVGALRIDVLETGLQQIARRHEALRTRIVMSAGQPLQQVLESQHLPISLSRLAAQSGEHREVELARRIDEFILAPIHTGTEAMLGAHLIQVHEREHLLILAAEHTIADGYSLDLLRGELFTAYAQLARGEPVHLPPIQMQFPAHATRLRQTAPAWQAEHAPYWQRHLQGAEPVAFPEDTASRSGIVGWGTLPLHIPATLRAQLQRWASAHRTTLVMTALTVFAALLLRWCKTRDVIVQFQSNGRTNAQVQNTVGYFASALYLRLQCAENDDLGDLLGRVMAEYCQAYEHFDHGYLAANLPRPAFTHAPAFNWIPQTTLAGSATDDNAGHGIHWSAVPFTHPMMRSLHVEGDPSVILFDDGFDIHGELQFPLSRFSGKTMERFGDAFTRMLDAASRTEGVPVERMLVV